MKRWTMLLLCFGILMTLSACSGSDSVATIQKGGAIQGRSLALSTSVTTLVGSSPGMADGTGTSARFENPTAVTSDGVNIYIADSDNHTIRKMVIATGEVTTLAGKPGVSGASDGIGLAARFYSPVAITTEGSNLYVCDGNNQTIRKIAIATGEVTTLAGSAGGQDYQDGTGAAARFRSLQAITTDGTNLYVADDTFIRRVALATRVVTTLAGTPRQYMYSIPAPAIVDGTGAAATFYGPRGMTTDGTNLFVTDMNTIRKVVIATGAVTTIAGDGNNHVVASADGIGAAVGFSFARGITNDGTDLYIADGNAVRRLAIASGQVSTVAGQQWPAGYADGTGSEARFNSVMGIVAAGSDLFVADSGTKVIRKIVKATGVVSTSAGRPAIGSMDGPVSTASFFNPTGIATDGGSLFVADENNYTIRKIDLRTQTVTTLAGSSGQQGLADGAGTEARFLNPQGITTDGTNLYITDAYQLRKLELATGLVTTLGATGGWGPLSGTGSEAAFYAQEITTDGTSLFVNDNYAIAKIVIATGERTTLAGTANMFGWADGPGAEATFGWIEGLTTDGTSLYVSDSSGLIRKVAIATGEVTTIAGRPWWWGSANGYGTSATFVNPRGITTDGISLFIAEGSCIRRLLLATGEVTTVAGRTYGQSVADGTGAAAGFAGPNGITTDGRSLYVTDGMGLIRRIN